MDNLGQYDLTTMNPGINIIIIGSNITKSEMMGQTISQILMAKMNVYNEYDMYESQNFCSKIKRYYSKNKNQFKEFKITILLLDLQGILKKLNYDNYNLAFVQSKFKRKKYMMEKYNIANDMINYSSEDEFFVMQKGKLQICKPESYSMYFETYQKNPFCYSNIIKLKENITNDYSIFHKNNSTLYKLLQTKLEKLYVIYSTIYCMKNIEDINIWLPQELNLEIINLLCLSCL